MITPSPPEHPPDSFAIRWGDSVAAGEGPVKGIFTAKAAEQYDPAVGFPGLPQQFSGAGDADIFNKAGIGCPPAL